VLCTIGCSGHSTPTGCFTTRAGRIPASTGVFSGFSREAKPFTHLALLDHQDWLAGHNSAALDEEWRTLIQRSLRGTRILLRSAGMALDFLPAWIHSKIGFRPDRTVPLHRLDRVGTYGSLHLAEVL
jgi:S-adenosylmethionine-diacylglycerol 3-amino-3-carboxypropyl transferase